MLINGILQDGKLNEANQEKRYIQRFMLEKDI